jgi:GrpB-like predicted nucleotidyltransferase (UPF0157 family)
MLGLPHGQNYLVDYDPAWSLEFEQEATGIRKALDHLDVKIEHYGSTAVPSLRAKPILDILVGIRPLEKWALCRPHLEAIGYDYAEGAGVPGHHIFGKGRDRTHLVHIVEYEGESWRENLLFRDELRRNNNLRAAYLKVKEDAARQVPEGRSKYNEVKGPFIERTKQDLTKSLERTTGNDERRKTSEKDLSQRLLRSENTLTPIRRARPSIAQ